MSIGFAYVWFYKGISLTFPSGVFAENILHVLNLFGSVYGEDDVSFIEIKAFCRVKAREPSSVSCGYNVPSVKRIGVRSPKVISVFMGGLTIKEAYDRICLEDFRQTCFRSVVGV